jgi:hypothetical protein
VRRSDTRTKNHTHAKPSRGRGANPLRVGGGWWGGVWLLDAPLAMARALSSPLHFLGCWVRGYAKGLCHRGVGGTLHAAAAVAVCWCCAGSGLRVAGLRSCLGLDTGRIQRANPEATNSQ